MPWPSSSLRHLEEVVKARLKRRASVTAAVWKKKFAISCAIPEGTRATCRQVGVTHWRPLCQSGTGGRRWPELRGQAPEAAKFGKINILRPAASRARRLADRPLRIGKDCASHAQGAIPEPLIRCLCRMTVAACPDDHQHLSAGDHSSRRTGGGNYVNAQSSSPLKQCTSAVNSVEAAVVLDSNRDLNHEPSL